MNGMQTWQRTRLAAGQDERYVPSACTEVTALAYHFWDSERFDEQFAFLECAIRETWRWCGLLKTVLVVNRVTPRIEAFAEAFSGWVRFDVLETLIPGNLHSMSADCNAHLHRRFDTPYVLVVQNDGFPIRSGLDAFVGVWDFIGAPYVRNTWCNRIVCGMLNCWVSNGGFSLRSSGSASWPPSTGGKSTVRCRPPEWFRRTFFSRKRYRCGNAPTGVPYASQRIPRRSASPMMPPSRTLNPCRPSGFTV